MMAVSQVLRSKYSLTVSRLNKTCARNPPSRAPTMPMMMAVMTMPPGVITPQDGLGDGAGDQPENDLANDPHSRFPALLRCPAGACQTVTGRCNSAPLNALAAPVIGASSAHPW